ncbi:hypothetical protein OA93_10425 [Flavobacterium sp. KMS]|nr:hypothetical protein OA93_10425 [Flavobacterium sp. KMS]
MIFHINLVLYFEYSKILILEILDWFGLLKFSYLSIQYSHKLVFLRNEDTSDSELAKQSPHGTHTKHLQIVELLAKISPPSKLTKLRINKTF